MNTIPQSKRLSYAATDTAGQLVFAVISTYLLYFYTDVYGIPVGIAGTILLVARCIDGIDAPVWGMILDKTRSRWGRYRPWFLWLCGPYAVFGVLTFLQAPPTDIIVSVSKKMLTTASEPSTPGPRISPADNDHRFAGHVFSQVPDVEGPQGHAENNVLPQRQRNCRGAGDRHQTMCPADTARRRRRASDRRCAADRV